MSEDALEVSILRGRRHRKTYTIANNGVKEIPGLWTEWYLADADGEIQAHFGMDGDLVIWDEHRRYKAPKGSAINGLMLVNKSGASRTVTVEALALFESFDHGLRIDSATTLGVKGEYNDQPASADLIADGAQGPVALDQLGQVLVRQSVPGRDGVGRLNGSFTAAQSGEVIAALAGHTPVIRALMLYNVSASLGCAFALQSTSSAKLVWSSALRINNTTQAGNMLVIPIPGGARGTAGESVTAYWDNVGATDVWVTAAYHYERES